MHMQAPAAPQMPYVQAPQMPYVQSPAAPQMPYVQAPVLPQPVIPQASAPQVTVPPATVTAKGPSNTMLLIAIVALLCFIGGIAITILVMR
jgi:hypothetical protein